MEESTIGLLAVGGMITMVVIAGLAVGYDGTLILSGTGSLCTIFGVFIGYIRKERKTKKVIR